MQRTSGFTIVELMIATAIFLITIVGVLYSYLKCMELADLGRNAAIATHAVKNQLEDIKNANFATLFTTYNNATFTATGINGRGAIYVNNANPSLPQVKIVFCWKQSSGRLIGEDSNLNGVLNTGEDANGNGQLDSYVQIITNIFG